MNRIVGLNGLPVNGEAPPVLAPGQQQIGVGLGETPVGIVMVVLLDRRQIPVQFQPGKAAEFGAALIGADAVWRAKNAPESGVTS